MHSTQFWLLVLLLIAPAATHKDQFASALDSPYVFAELEGLQPIKSLDDYLRAIDAIFARAVESDAACLKSTLAYERTLRFENAPREQAEKILGRPRSELSDTSSPAEQHGNR